jgi:anti-anti-sigma regulatory factor
MEAAQRPHEPFQHAEAPAPPKLVIEKFADGGVACLRFIGTIDESFEGKKLGATAAGDVLVIDLGAVKKISSFGIREWVDFVAAAAKQVRSLVLVECAPKVVDQLNMVANFAGGGRVFSFYAPFRCDYCDSEHRVLLQVDKDYEIVKSMKLAERPCPSCKEAMYFDEDGATFFSYILGQEKFELEPAVVAFLQARLSYAVSDLNKKLHTDKVVEGRTTYLRLSGDLDRGFPRDKLAEGLEGTVLVDLANIGRIEPAGAAEWRGFVQMVTPIVDQLYLAAVPPAFAEKLCSRDDLGAKTQVLTLTLPYTCGTCGTLTNQTVEVEPHHDLLKFATAPELHCTTCKTALQCVAADGLMAVLPDLPKPAGSADIVKALGFLRERAHVQHRKPTSQRTAATAPPIPTASRPALLVPFLAAALAVVLAAASYLIYQRLTDKPVPATGEITNRSAPARPAWIASDTPASASCADSGKGISCVGVSALVARQDDAEDEAADAALDAVANAVAVRIADAKWKQSVLPIFQSARAAKLAAFDRDPSSTTARRDVREARRAVALSLRATSGGAVPAAPTGRYWEELAGTDGKRYIAFAQVALGPTELARLVDAYTQQTTALGASVVGAFPLVAWSHPNVERGAIVVSLASGPLQNIGIGEQYIILGIDGRDVTDAGSYAKLATDEYQELQAHGGTLRLKVQTTDPAPREFSASIKGPVVEPTPTNGRRLPIGPGPGPRDPSESGGVNVWDRFGGNRGSGRDDPTQ